jgi:hypothetical protein
MFSTECFSCLNTKHQNIFRAYEFGRECLGCRLNTKHQNILQNISFIRDPVYEVLVSVSWFRYRRKHYSLKLHCNLSLEALFNFYTSKER